MLDKIIDLIERSTCFDYSKAEYSLMVRELTNEGCKIQKHLLDSKDIGKYLEDVLDAKNELSAHLFGFKNLIELLDKELKEYKGSDLE